MKNPVSFHLKPRELALISILFLLLSTPAVVGSFWRNTAIETQENRRPALCPSLSLLSDDPGGYIKALEAFLNDRVGFRSEANKLYRKVRFYLFKDPPLRNISIGKDGFVFMNSHRLDRPNFVFNLLCEQQVNPSPELFASMDETFTRASRYYTSKGYDVTIVAAPTNVAIYPDKLPISVDQQYRDACNSYGPETGLIFQLAEQGRIRKTYKLHYPYELFKQHRDEPYFYPKEKWHWTGRSAFLFARDLAYRTGAVKRLILDEPAEVAPVADDLSMFFGFSRSIKAYSYPYRTFDTTVDQPQWQFGLSGQGGLTHYATSNALSDKRCLLIGNSFGIELAPHLATLFKDLYYFNLNVLRSEDEDLFFSRIGVLTKPNYVYILFDDAGIIAAPKRLAAFFRL